MEESKEEFKEQSQNQMRVVSVLSKDTSRMSELQEKSSESSPKNLESLSISMPDDPQKQAIQNSSSSSSVGTMTQVTWMKDEMKFERIYIQGQIDKSSRAN